MHTDKKNNEKSWIIYISDDECDFCTKAINKLTELKNKNIINGFIVKNITKENKKEVNKKTKNYKYFPKIFDGNDNFIGGFSELQKYFQKKNKKWVIYISDDECNCCTKALKKLKDLQENDIIEGFIIKNITKENEKEINTKTKNYKYFPKIFDGNDNFIGGFSDLQNYFEEENTKCIIS